MTQNPQTPLNFGGLDLTSNQLDDARVLIWPIPFEGTVSYGHGTQEGPGAIIEASGYMELYDEELNCEPSIIGLHTLPPLKSDLEPAAMMASIQAEAERLLESGKFLCALGGEHSISSPIVRAVHKRYPSLSVLQIDAHADLRAEYQGTPHSHASVMRRVLETCPAVQVGIRSLSSEEAHAIPTLPTKIFYAKDICGRTDWVEDAVESLTQDVYLTIDVDGMDPSLVPSTGTPEPGGLLWYEVLTLIRTLAARRNIVAMDMVELCRCDTSNAPAFLSAKLIYKTLGYIFREQLTGARA